MSSYEATYANSTTDLQYIEPNINNYNMRRVLQSDWQSSGTTDLYYLYSSGHVTQLFKDGEELTSVTDTPNANKEYNYNSSTGLLSLFLTNSSTTLLNSSIIEGGRDWEGLKLEAVQKASDMVRNIIPFGIYPRKGVGMESATGNNWPELVVRSTAIIACSDLIRPFDFEKAEETLNKAMNADGTGFLDMIRKGEIALYQDEGMAKHDGILREISINASSTGSIIDVKGSPSVDWDVVKIIITTAGTFSSGSASSVKYSTFISDDTGLKTSIVKDAEIIDGSFQDIGRGMAVRFSPGVYTISDEWELEISGVLDSRTMAVKHAKAERI